MYRKIKFPLVSAVNRGIKVVRPQGIILCMLVMIVIMTSCCQIAGAAQPTSGLGSLLGLDLRVFVVGKPIYLVLVEKDKQRLRVLKHDGRLRVVVEYPISTGENAGQKEREGDEKTPEGIYFITKIYTDKKLTVFGKRAFHLDYPNIFDRQEGRSGTGIFIHGTNKKLSSNSTNGCISLNNDDLEHIVKYLPLGVVPVVVVSSLTDLTSDMISDMAVSEFVNNDFQRAREALGPNGADAGQIVFESLYMIGTNSQTVAVGEYKNAGTGGKEPGELVRGYLQYTAANGWAVIDRVRKINGSKGTTLAFSRKVNLQKVNKVFVPEIIQGTVPYSSLWPDPDNQYLTWYREALSEGVILQKTEPPAAQEEISRSERTLPEFAILFFLSVVASIGSAWLVLGLRSREHGPEHGEIDEQARGKQLAAVARIQKDIAWSSARLAQLKLAAESGAGSEKELLKATLKITTLEGELSALRDRFHVMEGDYQGAIAEQHEVQEQVGQITLLEQKLAEKSLIITELSREKQDLNDMVLDSAADREEILGLRTEVHDMAGDLQAAATERQRLAQQVEELSPLAEQLSTKQVEIVELLQEKEKLADLVMKEAEDRDELALLRNNLQEMEADLQNATKERHRLGEQVGQLSLAEKKLSENRAEIADLVERNKELYDAVQERTEDRDELSNLHGKLQEMAADLQKATEERHRLGEQVGQLSLAEKKLAEKRSEIAGLVEKNRELYDAVQKRTEDRDELSNLHAKLQEMTADFQKATEERQHLTGQVRQLSLAEKDLAEKRAEIANLIDENQKLNDFVQQRAVERDELTDLQHRLHEMAETLEVATTERQNLIEEVARLKVLETELPEEVSEEVIEEADHEVTKKIAEEVIEDTVSESYLPSDVLKQWIGA